MPNLPVETALTDWVSTVELISELFWNKLFPRHSAIKQLESSAATDYPLEHVFPISNLIINTMIIKMNYIN